MADLKTLKGVGEKDRKLIEDTESLLGPEPGTMGFVKNLFWGNVREELVFPYPAGSAEETARCDELISRLDRYLETEHPANQIDADQEIPRWVVDRLFQLGVLGMTIPKEFGGGGFGITSYNRVLERIGQSCGSTAVMVSAHQSIGCKAVMLFGTDEQKSRWLRHLATDWLSAFCLSEPNVGCDAGGQETRCELSADGQYYILNGEKKWTTSGALSGLFTVMAKQELIDPKRGKPVEKVTALICTCDMEGIEIFQKNRSKCGIRGTWQARIRFHDVKVPRANLLHQEGRGLNVALTCLNYGRCTLSAGMLGGARRAFAQGTKWAQTRFQFQRALADFELVQQKIAEMAAYTYAMDAVLYMTTGMLDRRDEDIMLETAVCKVFCSEMGWRCVNHAMQIMGGEGYMTENQVERIFRDSRINLIVEGANEVMQSFIFAYGGKQLAEKLLGVQQAVGWDHSESPTQNLSRILHNLKRPEVRHAALPLASELFLGHRPQAPEVHLIHETLKDRASALAAMVAEHSHQFKLASKHYGEQIISRQAVQARLADSAMWLHAWACTLSKLDSELRANESGPKFHRDHAAAMFFMDMAATEIRRCHAALFENDDESMKRAAETALKYSETLPNGEFVIPEGSPNARGTGKVPDQAGIRQFPGDGTSSGSLRRVEARDAVEVNGDGAHPVARASRP
ncbi:MAG TPA: acyl-CoA dehydrogenase family protein [Tepidisphaeraceae bacterium]|jgi:alkylation response protein AidB-like acyl-CoA dehydrogenase|nr:acyl-CoA dehydrogenase family protein [Tepidisphaeraceae bacterium]